MLSLEADIVPKRLRIVVTLVAVSVLLFHCLAVADAAQNPEKGRAYYEPRGDIVWEVPGDEKILALTFDDGPDSVQTPLVLDLLKQYRIKATFFVIGNKIREHPDIAKREAAEGHELANHTYSHRFLGQSTVGQIQREMVDTQTAILEATGRKARLFRPPGGVYNSRVLEASKREQLQMVMWSWHQDTRDWSRPGVRRIVRKVLRNARNGDIILLHDYVSGQSQTAEALKIILPELIKSGYHFVTVSELIGHSHPVS
jgi:peptidoglycan/xylan/chitin deacetylase (PgdA/CDA1 family)